MRWFLLGLLAMVVHTTAYGTTRSVPSAYPSIQAAILASIDHDTVLVAPGTYYENINFRGRNIVVASHFIVDGSPAHITGTTINGSQPPHPDTASCALIVSGEDRSAVLEGFTLTGGTGTVWTDIHNNLDYREGGGLLVELSSPTIRHNVIVENDATDDAGVTSAGGGGIRCGDGDPLISHNVITRNRGRYGAGIVMNYCTGTIANNVICDNEGGQDYGGSGIWLYEVGPTVIDGNTIAGNNSALDGGGILVWATAVTGRNNILWGNVSSTGSHQIGVSGGSASFSYCDVQGGWVGEGNIDANPVFDAANLYLTAASPCVDAGDPGSPSDPEDPDWPGAALYPAQGGLRCDMGAYGGGPWPVVNPFTVPGISVPVSSAVFDYVEPGSSDTLDIAITAVGSGALIIDQVVIEDVADVVTVASPIPMTVPPFGSASLRIVWAPVVDEPLFGTLLIHHNDPSAPDPWALSLRVQQFAAVTAGPAVSDGGDSRSANWIDYDGDGNLDLFVTNGLQGGQNNRLYRNIGDGSFELVASDPIVTDNASSVGSSWGDMDNDGDLDAFVVNWYGQNNLLYRNTGDGTFTGVTGGPAVTDGGFSETCAWADYDGDAWLDLMVANSGPDGPEANFLYRATGDGAFTKITEGDIVTDAFHSRGVSWADYDDDGDLDAFVANEANENNGLYRNDGGGSFTKITDGPVVTTHGKSFGGSWGDYDNDGDVDLFVANWGDQNNFLFRNNGDATFTRIMAGSIANDRGWSIGSAWGDYDNDGDLDLFVANGFSQDPGQRLTDFLYENNGNGAFTRITSGPIADHQGWSYGSAWGDYDNDGALDLFVARCFDHDENNTLYRNTGTRNGWLSVTCRGTRSNGAAIGARVAVKATIGGQGVWQHREISTQTGACGQNQLAAHFGLGDASMVDSLVIRWPRGGTDVVTGLSISQSIVILESASDADTEALPGTIRVEQSYPNPSAGNTLIRFHTRLPWTASIGIVDLGGRVIREIREGAWSVPGACTWVWDGTDASGRPVPSGMYVCRIRTGEGAASTGMVRLR